MTNMATIATRNDVETQILTPQACGFRTKLAREFESRRRELLLRRQTRQREIDAGKMPDFAAERPPRRPDLSLILSGFAAHCHPTL